MTTRKKSTLTKPPTMPTPFFVRQGDVLLVRVASLPANTAQRKRDQGRVILAYGEVTGHCHQVIGKSVIHYDAPNATEAAKQLLADAGMTMELSEANAPSFLDIGATATVEHDEHTTHTLAPGCYVSLIQTEWSDTLEPIQVQD